MSVRHYPRQRPEGSRSQQCPGKYSSDGDLELGFQSKMAGEAAPLSHVPLSDLSLLPEGPTPVFVCVIKVRTPPEQENGRLL